MQKVIPLSTQLEKCFQMARLQYKQNPTPWNFQKLRAAYAMMEEAANGQRSA